MNNKNLWREWSEIFAHCHGYEWLWDGSVGYVEDFHLFFLSTGNSATLQKSKSSYIIQKKSSTQQKSTSQLIDDEKISKTFKSSWSIYQNTMIVLQEELLVWLSGVIW